jgi:hypothetical protein
MVIKQHNCCVVANKKKRVHPESVKRKWVRLYNHYGKDGLTPRNNRSYSVDFKLKVLQSIQKNPCHLWIVV